MISTLQHKPCAIVVLGTYGSGSSAVAGVLNRLGVMMGVELAGAASSNPKGHFEDMLFRRLLYKYREDKSFILHLIAFIEDRYENFNLWGVKEPAILEAIMDLGPTLSEKNYKIIATNRDVTACARSYLRKWPGTDFESTYEHIIRCLEQRQAFLEKYLPNILNVDFNELTDNVEDSVKGIRDFVFGDVAPSIFESRPWPSEAQLKDAVTSIDPKLNHHLEN